MLYTGLKAEASTLEKVRKGFISVNLIFYRVVLQNIYQLRGDLKYFKSVIEAY